MKSPTFLTTGCKKKKDTPSDPTVQQVEDAAKEAQDTAKDVEQEVEKAVDAVEE